MLTLSNTTGYAVLALGCLSDNRKEFKMANKVAECTGLPAPYLSKILNSLMHAGLVEGKRGCRGGFRLIKDPRELTLWEVAMAVEPESLKDHCPLGMDGCQAKEPCPAHHMWDSLKVQFEGTLRNLTVANMATFERCRPKGNQPCACA